jgi:hypothetical protein
VRPDHFRETDRLVADVIVILSVACLALGMLSGFSGSGGIPLWKSYLGALTTMFLALAALTRQPYWAASFRLLMAGWIIAAPYLLAFGEVGPSPRSSLPIGILIAAVSIPGASGILSRRTIPLLVTPLRTVRAMKGSTSPDI